MLPADASLDLSVRGLAVSATLEIQERCADLVREGRRIHRLGLGQSPFPVPPSVVAALRDHAAEKDYLPVRGLPELRRAISEYLRQRIDFPCSPADVLVAPGSKELMFLLQLVFYGDLLVPTPAWVSYAPQARLAGRAVSFLPTRREDGWRLRPAQLHDFCAATGTRPRVLVLNYPANPTGVTYAERELEELAAVARRHRLIVLSDEIYGELHFEGRHVSIARFYPEGTIVSTGLSKWCGAGGWRLGAFAFPHDLRWLLEGMAVAASETYTSTSAPIQHAAVQAFRGGLDVQSYLSDVRAILSALVRDGVEVLRGAGALVEAPEGAFYLFPDFSPRRDELRRAGFDSSDSMCRRLLEDTGVAVLPGSDFGRAPEEMNLRIAAVDFDGGRALAGLAEAKERAVGADFLSTYCRGVTEGVRELARWIDRVCRAA